MASKLASSKRWSEAESMPLPLAYSAASIAVYLGVRDKTIAALPPRKEALLSAIFGYKYPLGPVKAAICWLSSAVCGILLHAFYASYLQHV